MKLKVCGMKYLDNLNQVVDLDPDFLGFIFYPKSPRYMANDLEPDKIRKLNSRAKKVGVFVNETNDEVLRKMKAYGLDYAQLHGDESPDACKVLKDLQYGVIKVFHIGKNMPWEDLASYVPNVDFFLFDTKSKSYGGTGKAFDWALLESYPYGVPYFISGGIDLDNVSGIRTLKDNRPYALDVNSRFESQPGVKVISALKQLKKKILELQL